MREDREAAEPLGADVVIAFLKNKPLPVGAVIEICEMKEEAHVERLADRAEANHERMIEAGEMLVLKRCNDRVRERHRAGFDRIGGELPALDQNLAKEVER